MRLNVMCGAVIIVAFSGCLLNTPGLFGPEADADADVDGDGDGDGDGDMDTDVDVDADVDGDVDADADGISCTDAAHCDDHNECTVDRCSSGTCVNESVRCDDRIDCTVDTCDPSSGCVFTPDDGSCPGSSDICDPEYGCAHVLWVDAACSEPCSTECLEGDPCREISDALELTVPPTDTTLNVVILAPGTYTQEFEFVDGSDEEILIVGGPGVEFHSTTADRFLKLGGTTRVTISQMRVRAEKRAFELLKSAELILDRVVMEGHSENGIKAKDDATASLSRCVVQRNAKSGIKAENDVRLYLTNTLLIGNGGASDAEAGAIFLVDDTVHLEAVNCTMADNDGVDMAGAIRGSSADDLLVNDILWPNEGTGNQCPGCALTSCWTSDPSFVQIFRTVVDDYMLEPSSLARDAGTMTSGSTVTPVPDIDFWGDRRDDGAIDIGADEVR